MPSDLIDQSHLRRAVCFDREEARVFDGDGQVIGEREQRDVGVTAVYVARLTISLDATLGIASPAVNDTVTINSEVWTVIETLDNEGGMIALSISRSAMEERTGGDYRRTLNTARAKRY